MWQSGLWRHLFDSVPSNRHRMQQAAARHRQRIIQRVWSFESLEGRALLAALSGLHNILISQIVLNEMVLVIVLEWAAIKSSRSTSTGLRLSTSTKSLKL